MKTVLHEPAEKLLNLRPQFIRLPDCLSRYQPGAWHDLSVDFFQGE